LESIQKRLKVPVAPLIVPSIDKEGFNGYINLLEKKYLPATSSMWDHISKNSLEEDQYFLHFDQLISTLAEYDNDFIELLISAPSSFDISSGKIKQTLRKLSINRIIFPLACGSALKSISSVKPILDMVVDFLTCPSEQTIQIKIGEIPNDVDVCAFVFKITHEPLQRSQKCGGSQQMNFIRIYKGHIDSKTRLFNTSTGHSQSNTKIFSPLGDILMPIDTAVEGSIAVITGLENTKSGDTLVGRFRKLVGSNEKASKFILPGIETPAPVFFCSIEAPSQSHLSTFEKALNELVVEDPSIRYSIDANTRQTIISCMGELHIEIIKERFKRDYGLDVFVGPLQIGYREMLTENIEHSEVLTMYRNDCQSLWCSMSMFIEPANSDEAKSGFLKVALSSPEDDPLLLQTRQDWLESVNNGCKISLFNGPIAGEPVYNAKITITNFEVSGNKIPTTLVSACASRCLFNALKKATMELAEPFMLVYVTIMPDEFGHINSTSVLSEMGHRRADILSLEEFGDKGSIVTVKIPLSETLGLSKSLRVSTGGLVSFHMKLLGYEKVRK